MADVCIGRLNVEKMRVTYTLSAAFSVKANHGSAAGDAIITGVLMFWYLVLPGGSEGMGGAVGREGGGGTAVPAPAWLYGTGGGGGDHTPKLTVMLQPPPDAGSHSCCSKNR